MIVDGLHQPFWVGARRRARVVTDVQLEAADPLAEASSRPDDDGRRAVLDRHQQPLAVASQVEIAVAPGVQLR